MSAAELSQNKDRHPWHWYVEEQWCTYWMLAKLIDVAQYHGSDAFTGHNIFDPCCGRGNILSAFDKAKDHVRPSGRLIGWDIEFRDCIWQEDRLDFLCDAEEFAERSADLTKNKNANGQTYTAPLSIVSNPPYSMQDGEVVRGLSHQIIRRALDVATHKVCMLLPLKWLASELSGNLLTEHPARYYFVFNKRPSMPRGDVIDALGDKAFKRGKVDYIWVIWDKQHDTAPGYTRTVHMMKAGAQ